MGSDAATMKPCVRIAVAMLLIPLPAGLAAGIADSTGGMSEVFG